MQTMNQEQEGRRLETQLQQELQPKPGYKAMVVKTKS